MTNRQVNTHAVDWPIVEDFLLNILQRDKFHLYSIGTGTGKNPLNTKHTVHLNIARHFIESRQALGHGIYWAANLPEDHIRGKAEREELRLIDLLHTDIDPPDGMTLEQLRAWQQEVLALLLNDPRMPCSPSAIIMSGSGIQPIWILEDRLPATPENIEVVETINKRLSAAYGGDDCFDVTRVLRLPGTTNFASAKKLKRGRKDAPATLAWKSGELFTLADFEGLPPPKASARVVAAKVSKDFLLTEYSEGYRPFTTSEVFADRPDIYRVADAACEAPGADRSAIAFGFIKTLAEHLIDAMRSGARALLDDDDVKRNLASLVWDSDRPFLGHYEEHKTPELAVSKDVQKALAELAHHGVMFNPARAARYEQRVELAELAASPIGDLDPHQARRLFIGYVEGVAHKEDLPNVQGSGKEIARTQLATEANVRQVLLDAQIVGRWDVMRDQPRYEVLEAAGSADEAGKPRLWFERALAKTAPLERSGAEASLVLDALAQIGLHQRDSVGALLPPICREKPFHPMEDYCKSVPWDGKRRIRHLAKHLTTSNPLAGRYLEIFFRQGVAVVMSLRRFQRTGEGEMISTVTVLQGPQGIGKTKFWDKLFPPGMRSQGMTLKLGQNRETDSIAEVLSGAFANLDEIESSFMRSDHSALKNFLSCRLDRYRVAYARVAVVKPRMTQIVGTSNAILLHDQTGSRRFNILEVSLVFDFELDDATRQQLYAEAWHDVVVEGKTWWLEANEETIRNEHNAAFTVATEEELALNDYFAGVGERHQLEWLRAREICKLIGVQYSATRWASARKQLDVHGCEYRDKVRYLGKEYRKVYAFPVLPERFRELKL